MNREMAAAAAVATGHGEAKPPQPSEATHPPALSPDKATGSDPPPAEVPPAKAAGPQLRGGGRILIAAIAAAATALSLAALLILLRGPVVATVPEAAKLYSLVGLAPDALGQGLEIRDIASARERVDGRDVLKVTGMVVNVVQSPEPLPTLRVTLFDMEGQELQWVTVVPGIGAAKLDRYGQPLLEICRAHAAEHGLVAQEQEDVASVADAPAPASSAPLRRTERIR